MLAHYPTLSSSWKWGVRYYDGQMDDCRLGLETVLTSTIPDYVEGFQGANVLNYTKLVSFEKNA